MLLNIDERFEYPRDVQSEVWDKWHALRDSSDLVIKMNTGSGKTVVALMILYTLMREKNEKCVYVVPDNYLVEQVMAEASALRLPTTIDPRSQSYMQGQAILVINIHTLVNGKSKFGIGDEGVKIPIDNIIIDDAHACIRTISQQFSISLPGTSSTYKQIFELFRGDLQEQNKQKLIEIDIGDPTAYFLVPFWAWQSKEAEIYSILAKSEIEEMKFELPLIKDVLPLCQAVVAPSHIEISPRIVPIDIIPSFKRAKRRIYLTATLTDDSVLTTHLGLDVTKIPHAITPKHAGDIGDRMIIVPQAIDPGITKEEVIEYCGQKAKSINVVVIVPSLSQSEPWKDVANIICDRDSINDTVTKLKSKHVGLVVFLNRYDGIDLPDNACRLLVIDGIPEVRRNTEKIYNNCVQNTVSSNKRIIQKIEQGMGRGVRSRTDYCAVILIDRNLTSYLYGNNGIDDFSPGTRSQLEISNQITAQAEGHGIEGVASALEYCISENEDWVRLNRSALVSLENDDSFKSDTLLAALAKATNFARDRNYREASKTMEDFANTERDEKVKGYAKSIAAEFINFVDLAAAQEILISAHCCPK